MKNKKIKNYLVIIMMMIPKMKNNINLKGRQLYHETLHLSLISKNNICQNYKIYHKCKLNRAKV